MECGRGGGRGRGLRPSGRVVTAVRAQVSAPPIKPEQTPEVPHRLRHALVRRPLLEVSADRALLRMPGAGRMLVTADDLQVTVAPGGDAAGLASLADPALALQWLLRAVPPLRASSVVRNDRGVLLAGAGSVGTSTIAAAMALRGWRVLGDAVAPVIVGDDAPGVVPTTDVLGLWPKAMAALDLDPTLGVPIRPGLAKRAVPADQLGSAGTGAVDAAPADGRPVPVEMVVMVGRGNLEPLAASGYHGFGAVTAVGHTTWHHSVALALHGSRAVFGWATALAAGARIVHLTLPGGADPEAAAELIAGVADGTVEVTPP